MHVKMKGLLKGLRYISHIFGEEEKDEIEIGFPTDVKHVAHIGWDGPTATTPSWMNNFKANEGDKSATLDTNANDIEEPKKASRDIMDNIGFTEESVGSSSEQVMKTKDKESKPPGNRRRKDSNPSKQKHASSSSALNEQEGSSRNLPNKPKKTRRKKMKEDGSARSSTRSSKEPPSDESGNPGSKRGSRKGSVRGSAEEGSVKSYGVSSG